MTSKRKKIITRVLCFMIAFSIILGAGASMVSAMSIEYMDKEGATHRIDDFRDTRGHWAQSTLKKWAEYEIIVGDNGNFMPNKHITRADLAVVIDRLLGLEEISYHYFQDLPGKAYYRDSMLKTSAAGYIRGTSENTLNPMGYATREEVAAILTRIYKLETVPATGATPEFKDGEKISGWAKSSIDRMAREGYMQGYDGKVRPKDRITRAEVITLFAGIADAYVPVRDVHGTGQDYRNDLSNNVVVARNITMKDSNLSKDLVLTQSGKTTNLERVTVGRRILALGGSTINLNDVKVPVIELYGRGVINGLDKNSVDVKIMNKQATGTRIDALPKTITLAPETHVIIENERFENETAHEKVITYKDIVDMRADRDGYVEDGPQLVSVVLTQSVDNYVRVEEIKMVEGTSAIVEMGIVEADKGHRPSIGKNTGIFKQKHSGRYFTTETYNFLGNKVEKDKEYRVYIKDSNGLYAYSGETKRAGKFDYKIAFDVKAGIGINTVDVELVVEGTNIPDMSVIEVLYSDKNTEGGYKKQGLTEEIEKDISVAEREKNKTKRTYKATVLVTDVEMKRDYGYLLTFSDGSIEKAYPIKYGFDPDNYERKYSTTTGQLVEQGRTVVEVQGNKLTTTNTDIKEYGTIYKIQNTGERIPTEVGQDRGWSKLKENKEIKKGNTETYNSTINIPNQGVDIYYASYAIVNGKEVYGQLKSHNHDWSGDIEGPTIEGIKVSHLGTFVVIDIKLEGNKLIDATKQDIITNFRGSDGVLVSNVSNKSLADLNAKITQDLWGTKSITIVINEQTLQGKGRITGEIRLTTVDGKKSGKYSIALTPENEIKFKPVGRDGNKVTYSVADPSFVNIVEFSKVVSGTNMTDWGIQERGTKLEITKENPGVASIITVEMDYYTSRNIGNISKETIITNITLP